MHTDPITIQVTTPAELLGIVPYTLGFQPRQSLVIMAFRDRQLLSVGRIDLPTALETTHDDDYRTTLRGLTAVLNRHAASSIMLAGYGSAELVHPAVEIATDAFTTGRIPVTEALRVSDGRYYSLTCPDPDCCPADGTPFDPASTITAATATFAGMVTVNDRNDLLTQLVPIAGAARHAFADATTAACTHLVGRFDAAAGPDADDELFPHTPFGQHLLHESEQAMTDARNCYRSGQTLNDQHAAHLTVLLSVIWVRDAAAQRVTGEPWEIRMWSDLTRRAEPDFVASPANLLATCALRAGNGLLASLAVARAINADPGNRLAHLLRQAITFGISPEEIATVLQP